MQLLNFFILNRCNMFNFSFTCILLNFTLDFKIKDYKIKRKDRGYNYMFLFVSIFIIYIPGARGIRRNITQNDDISRWRSPREISSLKSLTFKTNNANSRLFGELERGCLAWLLQMIFYPIFHAQNHIPWSYSPLRSYTTHTRWYKVILQSIKYKVILLDSYYLTLLDLVQRCRYIMFSI